MTFKLAELESILRELIQKCDLEATAIVSQKGQMICSSLPVNTTEKAVSAMAAALQSIAERVTRELNAGAPEMMIIDGEQMTVVIVGFKNGVVIGTAPVDSGIALIRFELSNALEKIQAILNE